ncbi:MAG TPA: hypothetical protein PLX69_24090 [Leptospiraceae bacterium]|nr:hypothetical protein [Leptospiraceae bacterium]
MKHGSSFEVKTLFDPLSAEWEKTDYAEKKKLLEETFKGSKFKNHRLKIFLSPRKRHALENIEREGNTSTVDSEQYSIESEVSHESLLLSVGLYLTKSVYKAFEFPKSINDVKEILMDVNRLKDGRQRRTRECNDILRMTVTREFFDLISSEGQSSTLPEKRKKLTILQNNGVTPLEILFLHIKNYKARTNREEIVYEAPYSAFVLCWNGDELL